MKLLKFGTRHTKVGDISLGVPDLVPAKPDDPGPLYVCVTDPAFKCVVALALRELELSRSLAAFDSDSRQHHQDREALKDKVKRLSDTINKLTEVIGK